MRDLSVLQAVDPTKGQHFGFEEVKRNKTKDRQDDERGILCVRGVAPSGNGDVRRDAVHPPMHEDSELGL